MADGRFCGLTPASAIQTQGYRELAEGESVSFNVEQGPKGPQAENIVRG